MALVAFAADRNMARRLAGASNVVVTGTALRRRRFELAADMAGLARNAFMSPLQRKPCG